ncbi:MAG: hypothetical protein Salg2KO_06180 [Salibacteraceae bacterium]
MEDDRNINDEPLRVLIVEDESIISEMVKVMLEDFGHQVIGVAHNLKNAIERIDKGKFNFAVLDINLEGGMEGLELAERLRTLGIPFIFLTSYADRYTVQKAKETMPGAYVIKPFNEEDLYTGLEMARMHAKKVEEPSEVVNIKDGYKTQLFNLNDILYLKADNIHVEYHARDRMVSSRQSLIKALESLPSNSFVRIHKSYAVNKSCVTTIGSKSVRVGQITLPLSPSYKDDFLSAMGALKG